MVGHTLTLGETMSLIKKILFIKEKTPPVSVTDEELDQLKREAQKQKLLADIETSKAKINKAKGSKPGIMKKIFGDTKIDPFKLSDSKRSYSPF